MARDEAPGWIARNFSAGNILTIVMLLITLGAFATKLEMMPSQKDAEISSRVTVNETRLGNVAAEVAALRQGREATNEKLEAISSQLAVISAQIADVKSRVERIEGRGRMSGGSPRP